MSNMLLFSLTKNNNIINIYKATDTQQWLQYVIQYLLKMGRGITQTERQCLKLEQTSMRNECSVLLIFLCNRNLPISR